MDAQSIAGTMERELDRLKAARPRPASRITRAEHILVTQLSVPNGGRPIKVRIHPDGTRTYAVRSCSGFGRTYTVDPKVWSCDCPDCRKRETACKHAVACWVLDRALSV